MSTRVLVCLALAAAVPAFASEVGVIDDVLTGEARQLSPTQAHLEAMKPKEEPRRLPGATMARLVGKMLSPHVKGLDLELSDDRDDATPSAKTTPGALHFSRRAELVYDNYRLGVKRKGVFVRYEVNF